MKCQKCAKPAQVHLTEIVSEAGDLLGEKRAVELHLCLHHAIEAGLVIPGTEVPSQSISMGSGPAEAPISQNSTAIVPAPIESKGLAVSRERKAVDPTTCPHCGMNWTDFKHAGVMGCPHDYELFALKMLPLLKRAQEGAIDHVGKVPPRKKTRETERQVITLRLQRELKRAVDAENYEAAAELRDQLRGMDQA
jgi:protein arginine kinase activator